MIETAGLTFAYPRGEPIFQDYSWQIERGQVWTVIGPSGCGKSTLLALLAGLLLPQQGQVRIDGQPLERPRPHRADHPGLRTAALGNGARECPPGARVRNYYGPDGVHARAITAPSRWTDGWNDSAAAVRRPLPWANLWRATPARTL